MSAIYDMISAFVALLMSAALLHFGASGESPPASPPAAAHALASSAVPAESAVDDGKAAPVRPPRHTRHLSARQPCHGHGGAQPVLDAVHAPSPARRG